MDPNKPIMIAECSDCYAWGIPPERFNELKHICICPDCGMGMKLLRGQQYEQFRTMYALGNEVTPAVGDDKKGKYV